MRIDLDVLLSAPELTELQMDYPRGLAFQRSNTVALHRIVAIFNDRLRDLDCPLRLRLEPVLEPRSNGDHRPPKAPNRLVVIDADVRFRIPIAVWEQSLCVGEQIIFTVRDDAIHKIAAALIEAVNEILGLKIEASHPVKMTADM